MKLKKLFVTFTLLLTAFTSLCLATACGEVHQHTFSSWEVVSAPTCTAFGLQKRTCECGQVEYETQPAIAHTPVMDEALDATCTEFGKTEGKHCGECGTILTAQEQTEKISHTFSDWEVVSAPTCTSFGLQKRSCECGQVEYETKAAIAHTPVTDEAVEATCTEFGKTEGNHCGECGTVLVAQTQTAKLSHDFSAWEVVSAPTCTSFGLQKRTCECGQVEYETKAALEHNPVVDESVAATCTEFGKTEGSHCDTCGVVFVAQSSIAPIGHNCNEITVLEEAYCNLDGCKRYSCSNAGCDYYYDESYALAELDSSEIYNTALQYTGMIYTFDYMGNFIENASAFLISEDGALLTSNLKLDKASSVLFLLNGEEYYVTEVLAYSKLSNIAVLKIDAENLPYANICMSDPVEAEKIYIVGSPDGEGLSMSSGIISNPERSEYDAKYIHHDAEMKAGHYGGPLLNRFGEVIGVNVGHTSVGSLSFAAWIAELEKLDYSTPMSMEEYGDLTYSPVEYLVTFAINFYNEAEGSTTAYVLRGENFYYALGYESAGGYAFVEAFWKTQNYEYYTGLIFRNSAGTYEYYAGVTDGVWNNRANGYIDAATYDGTEILTYDTYYGKYWTEAQVMALYSTALYDTLEFFSYCVDSYFTKITMESFGFTALSYEKDGQALDKLNGFVQTHGALDQQSGAYVLSGSTQYEGGDEMSFSLVYTPETENAVSSTVVNVNYYTVTGALYTATLSLNPVEDGRRFDFSYSVYNGTEYILQNEAWGYLNPADLTRYSSLYCYVFTGLNEYEDALLFEYTSFLDYILRLLNISVMPSISPELSVADLGFLFYFG